MSKATSVDQGLLRKNGLLVTYAIMLLVFSVSNQVCLKMTTAAMSNYGWFLTQLSSFIYVPVFALMAGSGLRKPLSKGTLRNFAIMGGLDSLGGVLMVLGGIRTAGTMQLLLSQAVIPFTLLMSVLFLKRRFHGVQYLGAAAILFGIVVAKVNMNGSAGEDGVEDALLAGNDPIFNLLFVGAMVPLATSSTFKEVAFRGHDGDLDVNVLQFYVLCFQVLWNFLCMPIYSAQMLGTARVPLSSMPALVSHGSKCLFLLEDQVVDSCGLPDQRACDHCQNAWVVVCCYVFANFGYNLSVVLVIKHGSAALTFLVSTLRMPLGALAFSSTLIMGSGAVPLQVSDLQSLAVILAGLWFYRLGGRLLEPKKPGADNQQGFKASPGSSPRNWFMSPSDAPKSDRKGRRFSLRPMLPGFAPAALVQPVFALVPHVDTPKPRSPDRLRSDLMRRLGTASPLHSPQNRHRTPNQAIASDQLRSTTLQTDAAGAAIARESSHDMVLTGC